MFNADARVRTRRVDRELGRCRAARRCRSRRDAPGGQALGPCLRLRGGEVGDRLAGLGGVAFVDPWLEVGRRQIGKGQAQVGEVALRVDQQCRHPGAERLFDQDDAEPGLARPGHPDDDAVRCEVAGGDRRGRRRCVRAWPGRSARRGGSQPRRHATRASFRRSPLHPVGAGTVTASRCWSRHRHVGPKARRKHRARLRTARHTPRSVAIGQWCSMSTNASPSGPPRRGSPRRCAARPTAGPLTDDRADAGERR